MYLLCFIIVTLQLKPFDRDAVLKYLFFSVLLLLIFQCVLCFIVNNIIMCLKPFGDHAALQYAKLL